MSEYILINGKKRAGKDHFAELLQAELTSKGKTSKIMSFADPIKDIICIMLDITPDDFDVYKNSPEKYGVELVGYDDHDAISINALTYRSIIQNFGNDAIKKHFGESVWVDTFVRNTKKLDVDYIIVPDFRFLVEDLEYKYNMIAQTVQIRNDDIENNDSHISENELEDFIFDTIINNTGYRDIQPSVKKYVKKLIKGDSL